MAATVASSPNLSPPSPQPNNTGSGGGGGKNSTSGKSSQSRMFRTLSRFLSGSSSNNSNKAAKQQSKGDTNGTAGRTTFNNSDSSRKEQQQHYSNDDSTTGSRSSVTTDNDGVASSMVAQYPTDSLSQLSRHSSIRSTSTSKEDVDVDADADADTDASIYRLPPSTRGPSSINSNTSSSFAPTHASTYRSTASTKPTTLLSVDSGGGANRIAVVPGHSHSHSQSHSNPAQQITPPTFSSLSPTLSTTSSSATPAPPFNPSHAHRPSTSSTTSSLLSSSSPSVPLLSPHNATTTIPQAESPAIGIPYHTQLHPRNNPHPSGIPSDNASLLTLASSGFAPSFTQVSTHTTNKENEQRPSGSGGGRSGSWGGGGLTSLKAWSAKRGQTGGGGSSKLANSGNSLLDGIVGGGQQDADEDASVRVLPGSRRNSEDSLGGKSTWSARVSQSQQPQPIAGGTSRKSVVSVKVGDYDLEEGGTGVERRDRRRSSMKTVETGYTNGGDLINRDEDNEEEVMVDEEEKAFETETEEAGGGGETEAQGVKKRAEERQQHDDPKGKGKGVDREEHEGLQELAPPIPLTTTSTD